MVCDGCGERFWEDRDALGDDLTLRLVKRFVADAQATAIQAVARRSGVNSVGDQLVGAGVGWI